MDCVSGIPYMLTCYGWCLVNNKSTVSNGTYILTVKPLNITNEQELYNQSNFSGSSLSLVFLSSIRSQT